MQEQMQLTPIPTPADFPVEWEAPEDAYLLWTRDRTHWPEQITPLEFSLWQAATAGMNAAYEFYGMANSTRIRRINTYQYNAMLFETLDAHELATRAQDVEAKIGDVMARLDEMWQQEWLPEIQRHLAFWETFVLEQASMPALLDHLDESIDRTVRLWDLHNRILLPMALSMSMLDDFYQDLFEEATTFEAYELLEGFPNKTVESGLALWTLSRRALASAEVMDALRAANTDAVLAQLASTAPGRAFRAELDAYLHKFGQRGDKWGWRYPTWLDDPTPVIHNLQDYITQPDRNLGDEMATLRAKREARVASARAQIQHYPQPMIDQFEFLLRAAQTGAVIKEDHTYWLDFRTSYHVRRVLLELGCRFVASGAMERPDDVFMLRLDEVVDTAEHLPNVAQHARVAERRAEMARFAAITPPAALGAMPPSSLFTDPQWAQNPLIRVFAKLDGGAVKPAAEPGVVHGNAGSPGMYQGTARIVRALHAANRLRPGDILVTETTAPPWTPLFATAGAVVTETGGILCHAAVVAREYGIPAVVGADGALAQIRDGQPIAVDGSAGVVRILATEAASDR